MHQTFNVSFHVFRGKRELKLGTRLENFFLSGNTDYLSNEVFDLAITYHTCISVD